MRSQFLSAAILLGLSTAGVVGTNLYIASYSGTVSTYSLTEHHGRYSLTHTASTTKCAPNPSWLVLDANRGLLYCLNEGLTTVNGSLSSFTVGTDGSLQHVQNTTTISGPVSGVIYGEPAGRRALALAHYTGSGVSSWVLESDGRFRFNQRFDYTLPHPGPNPARQNAPHGHEAIIDPTGRYVLVPDLGADLVRVYRWAAGSLKLTELAPLKSAVGSGPRHATFWNPYGVACDSGCTTYLYVVHELSSAVTGYAVTYLPNNGGLSFKQVFTSSTYGSLVQPEGNAPAEAIISPDNRFLIISNRNDSSFALPVDANNTNNLPQPDYADMGNETLPATYPSDSLSTFRLNAADGSLTFVQLSPAGGSYPRQFTVNALGTLVAVGLQYDNTTAVWARDPGTGLIGDMVAKIPTEGNVTCIVFSENKVFGGPLGG